MAESDQTRGAVPPPGGERDVLVPLHASGRQAEQRRLEAEQRCLAAERRCFEAERRRLEAERRREHVERLLKEMRRAGVRMQQLVGELSRLAAHLRHALERPPVPSAEPAPSGAIEEVDRRAEMADALAAAVERLRARVAAVGEPAPPPAARPPGSVQEHPPVPVQARPPHKHSMSGLARWRMRRRQRRGR